MANKDSGFFSVLQRVGRSFMFPIALLPVAGLLLGIGSSFSNPATIDAYNLGWLLGEGTVLNLILSIMSATGNVIFANLPLIFWFSLISSLNSFSRSILFWYILYIC